MKKFFVVIFAVLFSLPVYGQFTRNTTSNFVDSARVSGNGFDSSKNYILTGKIQLTNSNFTPTVQENILKINSTLSLTTSFVNGIYSGLTVNSQASSGTSINGEIFVNNTGSTGYGITGTAWSQHTATTAIGVYGSCIANGSGYSGIGIYGYDGSDGSGNSWAGKFDGKTWLNGFTRLSDNDSGRTSIRDSIRTQTANVTELLNTPKARIYDSLAVPKINGNTIPNGSGTFALKSDISDSIMSFSSIQTENIWVPANSEKDSILSFTPIGIYTYIFTSLAMDSDAEFPNGLMYNLNYETTGQIRLRLRNFTASPITLTPTIISIMERKY